MPRRESLPKRKRLNHPAQFKRLFQRPQVHRGSVLEVYSKPNEAGIPRLGITLKGRLTSVWRNKLKRKVREAFRKSAQAAAHWDFNFVMKPPREVDDVYLLRLSGDLKKWAESLK